MVVIFGKMSAIKKQNLISFFASPERASDDELKHEIQIASANPIIDGILRNISGILAVLDEHRQIVSVNHELLKMLEIENIDEVLGLRLGEVLNCVHAHEQDAGCGTSESCADCGAAIAIVSSLCKNETVEKICAATARRKGIEKALYLRVTASPIVVGDQKFVLLFIQDTTLQQQWAALDRVFFHDVSNIISGLVGTCEALVLETHGVANELAEDAKRLAQHLAQEVLIQKCLTQTGMRQYKPLMQQIPAKRVMEEVQWMFRNHPSANGKRLQIPGSLPEINVKTDLCLSARIMANLITNAFEASDSDAVVKAWFEEDSDFVLFRVWNEKEIEGKTTKRIFQRNFSTKKGTGRGLGTYSVKLFGEQFLGGKVYFNTSATSGTIFTLALPK